MVAEAPLEKAIEALDQLLQWLERASWTEETTYADLMDRRFPHSALQELGTLSPGAGETREAIEVAQQLASCLRSSVSRAAAGSKPAMSPYTLYFALGKARVRLDGLRLSN